MKTLNNTLSWARLFVLAGAVSFSITSCNTDDEPEAPVDPSSNPPTPSFEAGYGTLAAIKSVTTFDPGFGVPVQEIILGLGSAGFTDGTNYNTLLDAGTVTLEDETLDRYNNNAYFSQIEQTNPTGIDFSGNPSWTVSGSGSIPSFSHTTNIGFPTLGNITSATTIPATGNYVLTVANVAGADSVWYMLGGVVHVEGPGVTSSTFTEAEIDGIGAGANFIQVAPYRFEVANYGGKDFYFVTETVKTQSVTIE